jgi:hypothetical protein
MGQRILFDNDALIKLIRYGLLDETINLFGSDPIDVSVLATAKFSLLPAKNRLRFCQEEESALKLEQFLRTTTSLDARLAESKLLDALSSIPNIDAGESILFAIGATDLGSLVLTGDKRALIALSSNISVRETFDALENRVVSIEVLLLQLIESQFDYVQTCIRSKQNVDKAISIAFGVTIPADIDSVREGLSSYIQHLRSETGKLLYQFPR